MSGARNSPIGARYASKLEQHQQQHRSWDEEQVSKQMSGMKTASRTTSSPLPAYKCPKSPSRNSSAYNSPTTSIASPPTRSPSVRSAYSAKSQHSDPIISGRTARYHEQQPPRSPKITTTYANDSCDDSLSTPSSYYQTPTSGSRSPKSIYSQENSMDSPAGGHMSLSPRRSPMSPRKFVFDAISPSQTDLSNKKFEYYEPISPDENAIYYDATSVAAPSSPKAFDTRGGSTKMKRILPQCNEWEMSALAPSYDEHCLQAGDHFFMKRDSCVTESTHISMESNETATYNTMVTTTTSISCSDHSKQEPLETTSFTQQYTPTHDGEGARVRQRRHAINITSNPCYQVLHSSHSTLDRTCSDSVVALRQRKSTSDLTKDAESDQGQSHGKATASGSEQQQPSNGSSSKHRRRGSSKSGLALLASRRSSRESMKSACSNTSIFSNDDIGPLAFQASNRGRQRRTSNFLELPVPDHVRPRVCSLPDRPYNPRASDDLYRLRHFSISKGNVVNCGDSIISRRSRSNTSVNSTNSRASERSPFEGSCCGGGYANVDSLPASPEDDSDDNMEPPPPQRYRVVMLGDAGVGKTALVNQFMTSEYMHTYDASLDDEFGEKTVSVLLDDEESEMVFIDHPSVEMSVENSLSTYEPHGCVVIFSVVDKSSFRVAEEIINYLWQEHYNKDKAVILVGNKADLARARVISTQDGKALAASRDCKFIETSSGIQHNVDELLVGILKQMRLKQTREKKAAISSKMKTSRTHISLHLAKELLHKICLTDISKSKSCENLHVL